MLNCQIAKRANGVMTQTNKLEWWMILKISLRAKAGAPKTLMKRKLRLHSLYFPQNTLMLTESRGEFSDLHSIFRLLVLRYQLFSFAGISSLYLRTFETSGNLSRQFDWPLRRKPSDVFQKMSK